MFWSIIGLIGGASFVVSGISVLTDPDCATVVLKLRGRTVLATCYPEGSIYDTSGMPGLVDGLCMMIFGLIIIYISWINIKRSLF